MDPPQPFIPQKERYPWVCKECAYYIFVQKADEGCPLCDNKKFSIQIPSRATLPLTPLSTKPPPLPPRLCKLGEVQNIGQNKQRRTQGIKPKPEGAIRFVCISDTHSRHRELAQDIPDGDILLHSGDITMCGESDAFADFNLFLASLPHKHKVVIAGNHDVSLHSEYYKEHFWSSLIESTGSKHLLQNCIYLEDEMIQLEGINIYGSPWTPLYHDWGFGLDDADRSTKWDAIPEGIDVLVTHCPPKGQRSKNPKGLDIGDANLLAQVRKVKPLVHVFGHVHASYGKQKNFDVTFLNAASLNNSYHPVNAPIVFDILFE